jgi:hypothetical protein
MADYEDGQGKGGKKMDCDNVDKGSSSGLGGARAGNKAKRASTSTHFIRVKANEIEHETTSETRQSIPYAY